MEQPAANQQEATIDKRTPAKRGNTNYSEMSPSFSKLRRKTRGDENGVVSNAHAAARGNNELQAQVGTESAANDNGSKSGYTEPILGNQRDPNDAEMHPINPLPSRNEEPASRKQDGAANNATDSTQLDSESVNQPDANFQVGNEVEIEQVVTQINRLQHRLRELINDDDKVDSLFKPESNVFDFDEWTQFFDEMATSGTSKIDTHVKLADFPLPDVNDTQRMRLLGDLVLLRNKVANLLIRLRNGSLLRFNRETNLPTAFKQLSNVDSLLANNSDAFLRIGTATIGNHYLTLLRDTEQRIAAIRETLPNTRRLYETVADDNFRNSKRKLDALFRRMRDSAIHSYRLDSNSTTKDKSNRDGAHAANSDYANGIEMRHSGSSQQPNCNPEQARQPTSNPEETARSNTMMRCNKEAASKQYDQCDVSECSRQHFSHRNGFAVHNSNAVSHKEQCNVSSQHYGNTAHRNGPNVRHSYPANASVYHRGTFTNLPHAIPNRSRFASRPNRFPTRTVYMHFPPGRQPYTTNTYEPGNTRTQPPRSTTNRRYGRTRWDENWCPNRTPTAYFSYL